MAKRATKTAKATKATESAGRWCMSDLPPQQQAELRSALEEARRGEGLVEFDEAMTDAKKAVDQMLAPSSAK